MPVIFHSECNMSLEEAGLRILAISQHTIFKNVWFCIENGYLYSPEHRGKHSFSLNDKITGYWIQIVEV